MFWFFYLSPLFPAQPGPEILRQPSLAKPARISGYCIRKFKQNNNQKTGLLRLSGNIGLFDAIANSIMSFYPTKDYN